jgi:hypothetical protein
VNGLHQDLASFKTLNIIDNVWRICRGKLRAAQCEQHQQCNLSHECPVIPGTHNLSVNKSVLHMGLFTAS